MMKFVSFLFLLLSLVFLPNVFGQTSQFEKSLSNTLFLKKIEKVGLNYFSLWEGPSLEGAINRDIPELNGRDARARTVLFNSRWALSGRSPGQKPRAVIQAAPTINHAFNDKVGLRSGLDLQFRSFDGNGLTTKTTSLGIWISGVIFS